MVRADPSFPFNWHYHPEYELTLIVDSFGQRLVGDGIADYGPGDLVLLGPNLPHSWRSIEGGPAVHKAVVVQFQREFLGEEFLELEEMSAIARLLERSSCGLAFGQTDAGRRVSPLLAELPALPPSRRLLTLLSILQELAEETTAQPLSLGRLRPTYRIEYQDRLDTVCAYLEEHFAEEIDHAAVARLVHIDSASLCRFFKRATGRTLTVYVNEFRIAAASRLLVETDLSVLEIGNRVGFANHSNFNRQFKRLKKISPGALRKEFRASPAERHIA
jgi:AraC-like DNA-binding protein